MKINKTKIISKKAGMSYLQILILITASFAFAYLIFPEVRAQESEDSQDAQNGLFFSCCEKTTDNEVCQNIIEEEECQEGFRFALGSECDKTSFCKPGCCIDDSEGTFDKNVPQVLCQGKWEPDKNCNLPEAQLGCCVLGEITAYVTERRCEVLIDWGIKRDAIKDWRKNLNEAECVALSSVQEQGACVFEQDSEKTCRFTTHQECASMGRDFYKDILCTDPGLDTICEPTQETMCAEGKDGVYFKDSCGNIANIYDSGKVNDEAYWKRSVAIEDSCGADNKNGNANSKSCGNCNRFLGGVCSNALEDGFNPSYGNYYCKDTSCVYEGERYKNGESWCVYDGKIGDGDDIVGSRHWKLVCNQGEVQVEPCGDYRQGICVQTNTFDDLDGTEIEFKNAACRVNNWRECIDLNSDKEEISECEETVDCTVKEINFGESFNFNVCAPEYPPGFGFSERGQESAEQICGLATRTCVVQYEPKKLGGCKCIENCACKEAVFTQKMNDFCRSLGDCGLEVNILGEYNIENPSYRVKEAPKLNQNYINKIVAMAKPVPGQYAEVGNLTKQLQAAGILGFPEEKRVGDDEEESGLALKLPLGAAGISLAISTYSWYGAIVAGKKLGLFGALGKGLGGTNPAAVAAGKIPAWLGSFANIAMTTAIIVGIASLITSLLGYQVSNTGIIAGAVAGIAAYYGSAIIATEIMTSGMITSGSSFLLYNAMIATYPILFVAIGIAVAVAVMMLFSDKGLFGGDCPPKIVKFECKPWQPPSGGADCEKCQEDPEKPCSEYRCRSLGAACELINKGTEQELCIAGVDDGKAPRISPQLGTISPGIQYDPTSITDSGFKIITTDGKCLDAYTNLIFGVNTDKPAQCKFDLEMKEFEEMQFDLGGNAYIYNHTTSFVLPDPSHGQSQGLDWNGELIFYIKCRDNYGHENPGFYDVDLCVYQGPDITPPVVTATFPLNNALLSYNSTEQDVEVFTNEIAECKWSREDRNYEGMENSMNCVSNLAEQTAFGYECNTTLPINSYGGNTFYIRCKDQPWLEEAGRDDERNVNQQSYVYVLKKVESLIVIDSISPSEDFETSTALTTVSLEIKTSGGGETHKCSYSFSGYDKMIEFFHTYSRTHSQEFNLPATHYKIYVECEDETGDRARGETEFTINIDDKAPIITRAYYAAGSLKIMTSEEAVCAYSLTDSRCGFDIENATSMGGSGIEHSADWQTERTYYIKCKDSYDNKPERCSIVVRPYNLVT